MIQPLRAALLQDRKCGLGMPEENPGCSSFHRRISRRAIRCAVSLALLFARDSLNNGFIRVPSRSDDFPQGRVRIRSLAQDDCPEPRSQRILVLKGRVGDAQALRRIAAFRRDHCLAHERIGDNPLVPEFQSVVECPVCPVHRAYQISGVLENPPTELRELAGKPEHLSPVRPLVTSHPVTLSTYSLPTRRLAGKWWDRRVDERRKAGSEQRYLLGIIARTSQLYGLIGQIDATGCDTTDRRTRTGKPGCHPLSAADPGDAWPSAVNDR